VNLEFYMLHLMPYPDIKPQIDEYESAWVIFPNSNYDPATGTRLYNRYLDELEYAEKLGYDGVCVNEHHQNAYGTMPAPNIMAACLARRTSTMKICILGNAIALRDHPTRVAEEVAMLDVITGGRIVSGFVRGLGDEYTSLNVDPSRSRERFNEAYELVVRAWSEPGPFEFIGKHYKLRYVNVWPRPVQQPHPPIWVPGFGSPETWRWCADHRYTWMSVFAPTTLIKKWVDEYRRVAADEFGYALDPKQVAMSIPVYVAETDEIAYREGKQHLEWLYYTGLKHKNEHLFPPGYMSASAFRAFLRSGFKPYSEMSYDELLEGGYAVVGSPETVRKKIAEWQEMLGFGIFIPLLQIGDMPHYRTVKNMELFATEVMPYFKQSTDGGIPAEAEPAGVS
jgi:alkanesulfonate monooxygenase SsuD/methylene tetrahydromethanopterin reductase-like flavin-dependent oxidoreductase (luciferase family)